MRPSSRLADSPATGEEGSSLAHCPNRVMLYECPKATLPSAKAVLDTSGKVQNAVAAARDADVAIVTVGHDFTGKGESSAPSFDEHPAVLDRLPRNQARDGMLEERVQSSGHATTQNMGGIRLRD
ncbi:hypothetical protein BJX63DRAFT_206875 [Aspergillus granulosus]|uniref:Uncharacterized protein n=1 Tax=Aspergillus granulosus TaxID=176169 RepID=A0ABR4HER9_9EURO